MEQTKLETAEVKNETVETVKPQRTKNPEAKNKPRKPRKPKQKVETITHDTNVEEIKQPVIPVEYPKSENKLEYKCKCSCDENKCDLDRVPKWVWWSIGGIMILFLIGSLL